MGFLLIHPPHEYAKKSTQGSILRSIEVTSSAGSDCAVAGCWALARERKPRRVMAKMPMCGTRMECPSVNWNIDNPQSAKQLLSHFGHNAETAPASGSVDGKIALIEREDGINFLAMRKIYQSGIGELRVNVFIPLHERRDAFGFCPGKRKKFKEAAIDAAQQLLNRARRTPQEPSSLGDHRPA